jgi:hypothetical protein
MLTEPPQPARESGSGPYFVMVANPVSCPGCTSIRQLHREDVGAVWGAEEDWNRIER